MSECDESELSKTQKQILTGLLMGDGTLANRNKTPYLQCTMTNKEYLEHLSAIFPNSSKVTLSKTASKSAAENRKSGFSNSAQKENYSDVYRWATISRKSLKNYSKWYKEEGKIFPKDIKLTPYVLKHWYVCDGGLVYKDRESIGISLVNEKENKSKINSYFRNQNLPAPSHYNESKGRCKAVWTKKDSKKLFNYMKTPVKGFEHKFLEVV